MKYELRPYQKEASDAAVKFFNSKEQKNAIIVAPTGCHLKGSKILMYDGRLKPVEEIKEGDLLMGNDGTPRRVLCLHQGKDEMYRITPIKGEPFVVNGGHVLHLYRTKTGNKSCEQSGYDEITVREYINTSKSYKRCHKLHKAKFVSFINESKNVGIRKGHARRQKKSIYVTGFSVTSIGRDEYYGFTLDGNHLYCDGQFFVHHNCGKSLIIADIASQLDGNVLVLQPSKEILEQNFAKLQSYGVTDCAIYSASLNSKNIDRITFATIGSIINHKEEFDKFKAIIVDECHVINASGGMYKDFLTHVKRKVLGFTATPYRLYSQQGIVADGKFLPNGSFKQSDYFKNEYEPKPGLVLANKCMEKFLTRTRPRMFSDVIYQVSIQELLQNGFLARLTYFSQIKLVDTSQVKRNSTGKDYDDQSLNDEFKRNNLNERLVEIVNRLLHPKNGIPRKGILVFTKFIDESEALCKAIPNSALLTGETNKKDRERIINDFKSGKIKVLANVSVLTTGFDYPELDTIVLARPTMSLALFYQMVGRIIRPFPGKQGWVVDLCGNVERFGEVENFHLVENKPGEYAYIGYVKGEWKYLTNVYY